VNPAAVRWLSAELRERFSGRVSKVALDVGPGTCPNRDGTLGMRGCAWCDPRGSGPDADRERPWQESLARGAAHALDRGEVGVIAYFQAFSPTHAPAEELADCAEEALAVKGVVGLAVASRPDGLSPDVLALFRDLHLRTYFWAEVGMQSCHDGTLAQCNRGHRHAATVGAVEALRAGGLRTVLHLIAGLPGEGPDEMRASFDETARLAPWGVKLHPLHVVRGARLEEGWRRGEIALLTLDQYAGLAADLLERLPPGTVVHRLTGERPGDLLLAPEWCRDKRRVLNAIRCELARRTSARAPGPGEVPR